MNLELVSAAAIYLCATYNYYLAAYRHHTIAKKRFRRRRCWMRAIHHERSRASLNNRLVELLTELTGEYFVHMSSADFEYLLQKITPIIKKQDTHWRNSIPPKIRLAVTLRFLATGDSYAMLHQYFKISTSLVSRIIPEVCKAIVAVFRDLIQMPASPEEWLEKTKRFHFPHCLGALDGRHISIWAPSHTGPEDMNYQGGFSMVLLTIVDSDHSFMYADIVQSQNTDTRVFYESDLWMNMTIDNLYLPPNKPLPGDDIDIPYVLLNDGTLPLERHIMKPFQGLDSMGNAENLFNQLLYQTHSTVDNAFGILSAVFKVLHKPISLEPHKAAAVIHSCILLHNFLIKSETSRDVYCPPGSVDMYVDGAMVSQGSWRHTTQDHFLPLQTFPCKPDSDAVQVRLNFLDHINRNMIMTT